MNTIDRQTQPAMAERPLLRLLERPQRPPARRTPLPASATVWSRLERWAGGILR